MVKMLVKSEVRLTRLFKSSHVPESRTCFLKRVFCISSLKSRIETAGEDVSSEAESERRWRHGLRSLPIAAFGTVQARRWLVAHSTPVPAQGKQPLLLSVSCCPLPAPAAGQ